MNTRACLLSLILFAGPAAATPPATDPPTRLVEQHAPASDEPRTGSSFIDAKHEGRVRLHFLYVPAVGFAEPGADGLPTGASAELLRDFARHVANHHALDVEVNWLAQPDWSRFYQQVKSSQGSVFGIGNVTITPARRGELDFSPPYLSNIAVLVSHDDVPELLALDQIGEHFGNLTALTFSGTLHEQRIQALRERWLPSLVEQPVRSNDELVDLLASGPGYFGYLDVYNYWRARQAGRPLRRHAVADDGSEQFGVILPHGSDWTRVIEAFFAEHGDYARSDRFRDHLRQHLGDELATLLLAD